MGVISAEPKRGWKTKEFAMKKRPMDSQTAGGMSWSKVFLCVGAMGFMVMSAGCPKKKQQTTPPPSDMMGQGSGDGNYTEDTEDNTAQQITPETVENIKTVFRLGKIAVERCFQDFVNRKKDPRLEGSVIIGMRIGSTPNPEKVWIFKITPKIKEKRFVQCLLDEARKWVFPTWGGAMDYMSPKYDLLGL